MLFGVTARETCRPWPTSLRLEESSARGGCVRPRLVRPRSTAACGTPGTEAVSLHPSLSTPTQPPPSSSLSVKSLPSMPPISTEKDADATGATDATDATDGTDGTDGTSQTSQTSQTGQTGQTGATSRTNGAGMAGAPGATRALKAMKAPALIDWLRLAVTMYRTIAEMIGKAV